MAVKAASPGKLTDLFQLGLDAPICLTWELTYACNLSCVHCLSSSGRRDPRELTTDECKAVIDTLERMQVFYVNIGGGEPTVRPDFWELVDYATAHHVGVKFSTNGVRLDAAAAARLAASDYVDVQISLDGATREVNDAVRGPGSFDTAMRAMRNLRDAGFAGFKLSVVMTRQNIPQIDEFKAIADEYGAQLRLTRLRPSGRGADVWDELHPLPEQQRTLYDWLVAHGEQVLTGDSFFHLSAFGGALPGLNLCGAGRVVCLIDPVGDVYACPCVSRTPAARAGRAASTTPAGAAAWLPSSSPACRSTGPTRSACGATARRPWPRCPRHPGFRCRARRSTTRTARHRARPAPRFPCRSPGAARRPTTATRARSRASRRRRRARHAAAASLRPSFQE
jgi:mycofactocin radical SAM maturase